MPGSSRRRPVRRAARSRGRAAARRDFSLPAERVVRVDLGEPPHAHVVCRRCGRIQSIELTELDRYVLTELARHHPDGWSVDGVAFSATGACRRCREGPDAGP